MEPLAWLLSITKRVLGSPEHSNNKGKFGFNMNFSLFTSFGFGAQDSLLVFCLGISPDRSLGSFKGMTGIKPRVAMHKALHIGLSF